ncbi:MAG: N-acyl-D-amino-acid deacylase family protein, partial [Clostridium sp.]
GKKNWKHIDEVIKLLKDAEDKGIKITFDQYPYISGSTMLGVILPPWVHDGGTDKLVERLKSKEMREKMIYDMKNGIEGWENFLEFIPLDSIYITSVKTLKNKDVIGKNLIEIGRMREKDPYNATFDLLLEEENAVGMYDFYGKEEQIVRFMKLDEQNVCTDGLLSGKPHPRAYGAFPRILGRYVRELEAITLEEGIMKMSHKAALAFGIKERGLIKEGYFGDIVIFNKDTIKDTGTFEDPTRYPEGIHYVLINGEIVLQNGKYNEIKAGRVLRKGR